MKIFGREPALWLAVITAALSLGVGFGLPGLTDSTAGAITAVITAIAGVVTAVMARPVAPAVFTGLITTVAALAAAYGFHLPQQHVAGIVGFVALVVALVTRAQITPLADPAPDFLPIPGELRASMLASRAKGQRGVQGY